MSKFKAGDLALMIQAVHPENVGSCVELIKPDEDVSALLGETVWAVKGSGHGKLARESWLVPLNGDFQPEQQKSQEEIA